MEQLVDNAFTLRCIQTLPIVSILRPANAIELVKDTELLIK